MLYIKLPRTYCIPFDQYFSVSPTPQPLEATILLCFHGFNFFRFHMYVTSCSICLSIAYTSYMSLRTSIQNLIRHVIRKLLRCFGPSALIWNGSFRMLCHSAWWFFCLLSWCQVPLRSISAFGNINHLIHNSKPQTASNLTSTITEELKIAKKKILSSWWSYFI